MRSRAGFTLIETLIVMSILLILSAVAYPKYSELKTDTEGTTMSATVRHVRDRVQLHASILDVPMSPEGFPDEVTADWFPGHNMPRDLWTYGQLKIQVVNGPKDAIAPNNKSFHIKSDGTATGHTAWYNKSNGAFCMKVPDQGSEAEIEELFWLVNDGGYGSGYLNNGNNGNGNGNGGHDDDDDDD